MPEKPGDLHAPVDPRSLPESWQRDLLPDLLVVDGPGVWLPALRRALSGRSPGFAVQAVSNTHELTQSLQKSPGSPVFLAPAKDDLETVTRWLSGVRRKQQTEWVAVALEPGWLAAESLLRRAGATMVVQSLAEMPLLLRLLLHAQSRLALPWRPLAELVWARLPD